MVIDIINSNNNFVLVTHTNPDGDAIGSTFALASALEKMGKNCFVCVDEFHSKYNFLINDLDFTKELENYVFISLDCCFLYRVHEQGQKYFENSIASICIDHHICENYYTTCHFADSEASSTCELVYKLICKINKEVIDKQIASLLYCGLVTDTGGFRHGCTSKSTHNIVVDLMDYEIEFTNIYNEVLIRKTLEEVKIYQIAMEKMFIKNNIAISFLTENDYKSANVNYRNLDGIVETLLNIRDVQCSALLYEANGFIKVSFRSKKLNVAEIANTFGGGGHKNAAGATLQGNIKVLVDTIYNAIKMKL